jgi:hypothetical protein
VSVSSALALPLVASLATAIGLDAGVGLRVESRTSTVAPEEFATFMREALLARPRADVSLDAVPLRATASYAATIWTSDVEERPSPRVTHDAQLRLETYHPSPWRAGATVSAARGWTDPLADPVQALLQQGPAQSPALEPIEFEAFRGVVDGVFPLDLRTSIGANASAWRSGAVTLADRTAYPVQDGVAAQLSVEHLLSPRSTLRVAATSNATRTELTSGTDQAAWATGTARWRVRMTHAVDAWAGAGVALSRRDVPGAESETERWGRPVGEIGLAYTFGRGDAELSAQTVPFTDRFTGDVVLMFQGAGALRWRESPRVSFAVTGSGGASESGDTAIAGLDARGIYAIARRLSVEAAIVARWQHERAVGAPSFAEIGIAVAVAWQSGAHRP